MARDVQHIEGHCALCRSRCGARFVVEDGRLAAVEPLPGHPTGGALCAKGRAAPQLQYHPARLTQPLRRTRPRGSADPGWEPVTWDEAMTDIAQKLAAIRDQSGAHAVAFASASPGATALSDSLEWIERLVFAFGSPNFLTGVEICNWHRDHNHAFTFGTGIGMPDYANTDLVILWGFNPGNVWLAQAQALAAARARGARVLVIDPFPTRHAQAADLWLQVRPGTDAALALGLARELMRIGGHDEPFVRRWTNAALLIREDSGQPLCERDIDPQATGTRPMAWHAQRGEAITLDITQDWGESAPAGLALQGRFVVSGANGPIACRPAMAHYEEACEPWPPEQVEAFTGVPAQRVREAAALIAAARAPSYFSWTGIAQHANATQTDRAIAMLYALTGAVDAPGGNLHLNKLPANPASDRRLLDPAQAARALGLAERPLGPPAHGWTLGADFHRAVVEGQPYRVRALVGFGANLLMSQPDSQAMQAALAALEFQVHVDLFETPTARHADYLLPASTPWEREGLRIGFEITAQAQHTVQLRPAVVPPAPQSQARADIAIVFDLAQRLGLGEHFFGGTVEAGWNHQLAPLGLRTQQLRALPGGRLALPAVQATRQYAALRADGSVRGFATPSRRIELYSPRFQAAGLAPVPEVRAPRERFADSDAWPLTLCCAKSGYYCQSQHRSVAALRAREPEPWARVHPALARARGIAEGDWFEVRTARGAARFRLQLEETLPEDVVMLSFGWWQACADLGLPAIDPLAPGHSNMNALVDASVADTASGSVPLRAWPCDVRALQGAQGWSGWKAMQMRCVSRPAQGVLELSLAAADGASLPDHRAGQYVRVALTLPGGGTQERCYSLIHAAHGGEGGAGHAIWRIAVGQGRAEGMSEALHRWFAAHPQGALAVQAQRPAGRFLLPLAPERPTVLLAAGIGITPFLGMLETIAARVQAGMPAPTQPLRLLYGNRNPQRHAFGERIAALTRLLPTLEVIDFYSQGDGPAAQRARTARVGAQHIDAQWLQADARFYACGPPEMLRELREALLARGMPRHAFFAETFGAPAPSATADGPFEVHFVRSGIRATWTEADKNLLGLAERVGAPLTGGCRVGECESCRVGVRGGQVNHLAHTDVADEGDCLACIAVPASPLEIDA